VGAVLLLLGSAVLLRKRVTLDLKKDDRLLIGAFGLYFICCALINWFHGAPFNEYDTPLRFVLAIPALLLLLVYPPTPGALWAGVAAGGIAAGLFAGWQVVQLGEPRAYGSTNPIQYGNISLVLGVLCLAGLGWATSRRRARWWTSLLLAGAAMGVLGSIFTGSRGSWIALPVALAVVYKFHGDGIKRRYLAGICVALTGIFAVMYSIPGSGMQQRVAEVTTETDGYFAAGNANTSIGARFEMWRTGLMIYPERPWLGWGKQGYIQRKLELVATGDVAAFTSEHTHLHNEYLDALVKRGLPGLLVLLVLYGVPLALFAKRLHRPAASNGGPYAIAGVLLIVCYLFFGLTQAFLTHNNGVMILAFMVAILWSLLRRHERHGS
jgi:O-antigen ligase